MFYLALPSKSNGYIQVFLDGGLNQQRMGVSQILFFSLFQQPNIFSWPNIMGQN